MASLSKDKNGNRTIQFVAGDGKRRSVRLGKVAKRLAETIKTNIEHLNSAKVAGVPLDNETARWVASIGADLAKKLAAVGLIVNRETMSLDGFIRQFMKKRADAKPRTRINLEQATSKMTAHFGCQTRLDAIDVESVEAWIKELKKKYAPSHVARIIKYGKQIFHAAGRARLVNCSPFAEVKAGSMANPDRMFFVTLESTEKIIAACPDNEWRVIVALARYGGLRCPSELVALRWADINWEQNRFMVRATKTAHHADGGLRLVPLFPELRPHLETALGGRLGDETYVVRRIRCHDTNLRTGFERIVYKAGLLPWPKTFQNMRSSRETELMKDFPMHMVCKWIGNSAPIAAKHYLQVTDDDFDKAASLKSGAVAVQNAVQSGAVNDGPCSTKTREMSQESTAGNDSQTRVIRPTGVELDSASCNPDNKLGKTDSATDVNSGSLLGNSTISDALNAIAKLSPEERATLADMLNGLGGAAPNTAVDAPKRSSSSRR